MTVISELTERTIITVILLFCVIQSAQVMLIKIVNVVIIILGMNSSVITDWLKTSDFDEVSTSLSIVKSHNLALIRLYLINVLHDE